MCPSFSAPKLPEIQRSQIEWSRAATLKPQSHLEKNSQGQIWKSRTFRHTLLQPKQSRHLIPQPSTIKSKTLQPRSASPGLSCSNDGAVCCGYGLGNQEKRREKETEREREKERNRKRDAETARERASTERQAERLNS